MAEQTGAYPLTFSVDYPDRKMDRLSTVFRLLAMLPVVLILVLLEGFSKPRGEGDFTLPGAGAGIFLPIVLMLLFRQKYPKWWFDWNLALMRFGTRVGAYMALLRDEYPSTDEEQSVHLTMQYPDAKVDLNRWYPLIKWLLSVPHLFILVFLFIASVFCVLLAWFAIIIKGRYPMSLFNFVVGVSRWSLRVQAYAFLLITDRYPPFSLAE